MKASAAQAPREMAADVFTARLLEVLRSPEFRTAMIQRLVAATADVAEGCRIAENAVERVWEEAGGSPVDLFGRVVRAIETGCAEYATIRGLPYQVVLGPICRNWQVLGSLATQAGLTEEEGYAVMRDLLRKMPRSRWSGAKVRQVERELMQELRKGFAILGFASGIGQRAWKELRHGRRS